MQEGYWYAIGAYVTWGLFPIYWRFLRQVPAVQVIGHRIIWSCVMLLGIIVITRQWRTFRKTAFNRRAIAIYAAAGGLIAINWTVYVWAVNSDFILETSLGYFMTPLVSILLGVLVLGEQLSRAKWISIGLATIGVLYLTLAYGTLPWIALALACSFGTYGLIKKLAPLGAVHGLALETCLLMLPALLYLTYQDAHGHGAFIHSGVAASLFMIGAGPVTTIPLLLFAASTRRIPLSTVGLFQYINPSLQFLLGVLVYHEPFTRSRLIGFSIVWLALLLSALASHRQLAKSKLAGNGDPATN